MVPRDAVPIGETPGFFRVLVEHAQDILGVMDPDGTTRYKSPAVATLLGYRFEDLAGSNIFDLIHPDDRPAAESAVADVADHPAGRIEVELRFRHADGSWRILHSVAHNLLDDPDVAGIVVNCHDVTMMKALEARSREAARLYGVLLAARTTQHALNNQLTLLAGLADMLASDGRVPEDLRELANEATIEVQRAVETVDRLQQVTRVVEVDLGGPGPILDMAIGEAP